MGAFDNPVFTKQHELALFTSYWYYDLCLEQSQQRGGYPGAELRRWLSSSTPTHGLIPQTFQDVGLEVVMPTEPASKEYSASGGEGDSYEPKEF